MNNHKGNLWILTELRQDDPRNFLDVIIFNAKFNRIQTIKYQEDIVYIISEEQYKKLQSV